MTPGRVRALILGLIVLGILVAGFFGLRFFRAFTEFRGHRPPPLPAAEVHQIETDPDLVREWMTIPFVAKTYNLPGELFFEALNIQPRGNEEKSLQQLNDEFFHESPGLVIELVKAVIRANLPPPTAIPTAAP